MRVGMQIVPLAMLYWWLRHEDDDYKERPEWQDGYWIFPIEGSQPIRIPRAHEYGVLSAGIERMMDAMYDKDPEAIMRWFGQVTATTIPEPELVGVTPLFEVMFNYDHFRKRPIVPEKLQGLEPQAQYDEETSILVKHGAKFLHDYSGGKIKLSPLKIEHLVNAVTGGLYETVTDPAEKVIKGEEWQTGDIPGLKGVTFRKEYYKSIGDFYDLRRELSRSVETQKHAGEAPDPEDAATLARLDDVAKALSEMRKYSGTLPAEEELAVQRRMVGLARHALEREPLEKYPWP